MKRNLFYKVALLIMISLIIWAKGQEIERGDKEIFEPGDVTIWANDFSSLAVGKQLKDFKLENGSYEIVKFAEKKWLSPLTDDTEIVKELEFPEDFSFEVKFCNLGGRSWGQIYILPFAKWRSYGTDRFLELKFERHYEGIVTLVIDVSTPTANTSTREVVRRNIKTGEFHHLALQVKSKELKVFLNGERISVVPFNPEKPVKMFAIRWKYADIQKPLLFTDFRIATYSQRSPKHSETKTIQISLIADKSKIKGKEVFQELQKIGAVEYERGWIIPFTGDPFEQQGSWQVKVTPNEQWINNLKNCIAQVKKIDSGSYLLVEGFAPEVGETQTEFWGKQLRFWLSALRAKSFALWLTSQGIPSKYLKTSP